MPSTTVPEYALLSEEAIKTRNIILSFLGRCGMKWPTVEYDHEFDAICRAAAVRRGYPMEGPNSFARFMRMGVVMAITAYAHLKSQPTRVFVAIYTASLIYIDDCSQKDLEAVQKFNQRFVLLEPQGDKVLDCFARFLLEAPHHFCPVASNLITTSTLNLVTANVLEYETQGMPIRAPSQSYPAFARTLAGATEAYALFIFPPELELPTFIQAVPDIMIYVNYGNDLLSFHKEEIAGESVNYISLLAAQRHSTKHEALWQVSQDVEESHNRILGILELQPAALDAYESFASGYLGFHAGISRYKLEELKLVA